MVDSIGRVERFNHLSWAFNHHAGTSKPVPSPNKTDTSDKPVGVIPVTKVRSPSMDIGSNLHKGYPNQAPRVPPVALEEGVMDY